MIATGWHWFGTPEGAAALLHSDHVECPHGGFWPHTCWRCRLIAIQTAVEIERASVVAYLRSDHASACCKDSYADEIERGGHIHANTAAPRREGG